MVRELIKGATRWALPLALFCALVFAPLIIAWTHGPGLPVDSSQAAEQMLHGHSHDSPEPDKSGLGHNATDHEHQTQMLLPQVTETSSDFSAFHIGTSDFLAASLSPPGLRRPPKVLSA